MTSVEYWQALWSWVKWGRLKEGKTYATEWGVMEYEVLSARFGKVVGYWAYGSFDPCFPYQGQPAMWARPCG